MQPYREPAGLPRPERELSPRALAKGDRVRVIAADPHADPVVRRHGNDVGTVDHVFFGGAVTVALEMGDHRLFLREWLIALDG